MDQEHESITLHNKDYGEVIHCSKNTESVNFLLRYGEALSASYCVLVSLLQKIIIQDMTCMCRMDVVVVVTMSQPGAYSSPKRREKDVNVGGIFDGDYVCYGEESGWVGKGLGFPWTFW